MIRMITWILVIGFVSLVIAACSGLVRKTGWTVDPETNENRDLYTFNLTGMDGKPYPLEQHRGQVVMLVNTASKCGLTGQYDELEQLWDTYRDKGLVIIGQPSNDFMGQEPGTNAEIAQFCKLNYGVSFPLMSKTTVNGKEKPPLYTYLTQESSLNGKIRWNFEKFLIGKDGRLVARFTPRMPPDDPQIIKAIEQALAQSL